jgi:hypothetical protein
MDHHILQMEQNGCLFQKLFKSFLAVSLRLPHFVQFTVSKRTWLFGIFFDS